jgi:hypothetical protein
MTMYVCAEWRPTTTTGISPALYDEATVEGERRRSNQDEEFSLATVTGYSDDAAMAKGTKTASGCRWSVRLGPRVCRRFRADRPTSPARTRTAPGPLPAPAQRGPLSPAEEPTKRRVGTAGPVPSKMALRVVRS